MSIYYTTIDQVLRAAGCRVDELSNNAGWQRRARSSGGFASPPLGVQWHHTASRTAPANDLQWQCHSCPDRPVGNMLIDRDGIIYVVAAGAANTAGKGGPVTMSRGIVPVDGGNTRTWAIEVANNGVGEAWPQAQVDAYFRASNALNAHFGNRPTDVFTHALGTGNGWTNRKIDPATAGAVQGPWKPRSVNGSGTWSLDDIRAECTRRAGSSPGPTPPTPGGDDVIPQVMKGDGSDSYWAWDGVVCNGIPSLEWVQWGFEAGLYQNTDPVVYPQGFVDQLVQTQGVR
jgi:hypothetical protein